MTSYLKTELAVMRAFDRYWSRKFGEIMDQSVRNTDQYRLASDAFREGYEAGWSDKEFHPDGDEA